MLWKYATWAEIPLRLLQTLSLGKSLNLFAPRFRHF